MATDLCAVVVLGVVLWCLRIYQCPTTVLHMPAKGMVLLLCVLFVSVVMKVRAANIVLS